jgi:AAA15 family ATPase/GTPase
MSWESDGTLHVIDLLPAFFTMGEKASRKVFLIDELDRSLHPSLTRHLVETYLAGITPDSRTQIIFTTHDVQLMDQKIFRRDEMWAMERSRFDGSVLIPFSDFNSDIRYDKDIRKSYLQGRMGGVPQISGTLAFGSVAEDLLRKA